jgi:hypothetical protein
MTGAACRLAWAALLHDERREVNKRIHRQWREEGLQVAKMSPAATDDLGDVRVDAINIVGVSAGRFAYFRVISRRPIQRFRRSA